MAPIIPYKQTAGSHCEWSKVITSSSDLWCPPGICHRPTAFPDPNRRYWQRSFSLLPVKFCWWHPHRISNILTRRSKATPTRLASSLQLGRNQQYALQWKEVWIGNNQELKELTCYTSNIGTTIEEKASTKDLGVIMSSTADFKAQIDSIVETVKDLSSWILRSFKSRSRLVMLQLWKSIVIPRLDYCCLGSRLSIFDRRFWVFPSTAKSKIINKIRAWDGLYR